MAKEKTSYVCQNCGYQALRWLGQCPGCHQWNSLVETVMAASPSKLSSRHRATAIKPVMANEVKAIDFQKIPSQIKELDRVLGGGFVPGQVILFAGEPGIGKSTLLSQLALKIADNEAPRPDLREGSSPHSARAKIPALPAGGSPKSRNSGTKEDDKSVVYVCGEESPQQVNLRLSRLGNSSSSSLVFLPHTDVDEIIAWLDSQTKLALVIIDSIQTLTTQDLTGGAGSIGQVRETAHRLIAWAKKSSVPLLMVGHVTKQGAVAGPKVLEHAVDTVVYFEGERSLDLRLLRTVKNRFGPTDEIGIFQMTGKGLTAINEDFFLEKVKESGSKVGASVSVIAEGNRLMAVEVQALVSQSYTPLPRRVITGFSKNRAEMLLAASQKYLHLPLFKYDVFINIAGGIKVTEPAADLALIAAVFSSYKGKPLPKKSCFVGEVSLLGEIGRIGLMEKRVKYARELGIKNVISQTSVPSLSRLRELL